MESSFNSGSVIAKLMGFDEPPSQYPAMKKQRVLSEKYLQKIASLGVREKRSISVLPSVGLNFPDTILDLRESRGTLDRNEELCLDYFLEQKTPFMKQQLEDDRINTGVDALRFDSHSWVGKSDKVSSKSGGRTEGENGQSLQTFQNEICRSLYENSGPRRIGRFLRTELEPKDGLSCESRSSTSNSCLGYSENDIRCVSSRFSSEASNMVSVEKNRVSSFDMISSETSRINRMGSRRNSVCRFSNESKISEGSCEMWDGEKHFSMSKLREDRQFETLASPCTASGKRKYSPCPSRLRLKAGVVEKVMSEGQIVAENSEVRLVGKRITRDKFETGPLYRAGQTNLDCGVKRILRYTNDSSKYNRKIGQVRKATSLLSSTSLKTKSKDGTLEFGLKLRNSSKHSTNEKHFRQLRNVRSEIQGSLSVMNVERNTAEGDTCILPEIMENHGKDDISHLCMYVEKDEIKTIELEDDGMLQNDVVQNNQNEMEYEMIPHFCNGDSVSSVSDSSVHQETWSDIQDTGSLYSSCLDSEPDSLLNLQEACHSSPISVLDASFGEMNHSCTRCFETVVDDSYGLENESGPEMYISSDEDPGEESTDHFKENDKCFRPFKIEESRDFSYLLEVLNESGFYNWNLQTFSDSWHSTDCPINPYVFEALEKKFGVQTSWKRSDRRLIFDQINLGLLEITQPHLGVPSWKMPVSRRLNLQGSHEMIEEEMWTMLSVPVKETGSDPEKLFAGEFRMDIGEDIDTIARDIVDCLVDELTGEIV